MKTVLKFAKYLFAGVAVFSGFLYAVSFVPDNQPTGWVAPPEVSDYDFSTGTATLFRPYFNKADWTGNLYAYPVLADGTVDFAHERWGSGSGVKAHGGAAAVLDAQDWNTGRKIVTLKGDGSKIPFRWYTPGFGNITNTNPPAGTAPSSTLGDKTTGPIMLNYIRGDRSNESPSGTLLRARNSVLGDIIHSRPLYDNHDALNPRVYVGANDGMLHAFDANSGAEVFAYIPSMLISGLKQLGPLNTVEPFVHNYFVDGSPNAKTVTISGATKTILVGALGAGGIGMYALDITSATATDEAAAASKILWEITPATIIYNGSVNASSPYDNMGNIYGAPLIVKVNTGTVASPVWAAIVGNGYNDAHAKTSLMVIDLATGALIKEVATTGSGGLSTPVAIDTNGDGIIDRVYAGDYAGNLWKIDLSSTSSASWAATKLYAAGQAITGAPSVALHPLGGYVVNFATGRMFLAADATDATTAYTVYGLRDDGSVTTITSGNLITQTMTEMSYDSCPAAVNPCRVRISSNNAVDYATKKGWKLTLSAGERVVGDGGFINNNGRYTFTTTMPVTAPAHVPAGENWLVEVRYDTGGSDTTPFFDMNADTLLTSVDLLPDPGNTDSRVPMARLISYGVASQPIQAQFGSFSQTYFNSNPDLTAPEIPNGGVQGGHFDFDIYKPACTTSKAGVTTCSETNIKHVHQYDDIYNTTGVNMLDASNPIFNLSTLITSNGTKFKILVMNQALSPAVNLKIGALGGILDPYVPVWQMQTPVNDPSFVTPGTTGTAFVDTLPTWMMNTLKNLTFNMPVNAFSMRNWTTSGAACSTFGTNCRVGLVPDATGCVHGNANGGVAGDAWMSGALTIQIIADTTTDADLESNYTSDFPTAGGLLGYRLKASSMAKQLAQYTIFWHAEDACYQEANWDPNPPPVTATTTSTPSAVGSDPTGGLATTGNSGGAAGQSVVAMWNYVTGAVETLTITLNSTGAKTTTTSQVTSTNPSTSITAGGGAPATGGAEDKSALIPGRISWREVVRP